MPTVTLNKTVFEKLVGKKLPLEELKERISYLGTDLEGIEGDEIHVEIFPNRPDLLSEQGFARAFASFIGTKTGLQKYTVKKSGLQVIVDPSVTMRPYTACAVVKNLKFNEERIREIMQIQEKLAKTHGRDRKKSAYGIYPLSKVLFPISYIAKDPKDVMFQPLGFDKKIPASQVEELHPKGREYKDVAKDWKKYPFFIDAKKNVMCMLPYTNSHDTGKVDEETTEVFIECTGTDQNNVTIALNIFVTMLADMGGEIYSLEIVYPTETIVTPNLTPKTMNVDREYVNKRLGLKLTETEMKKLLGRMGFGYEKGAVHIPAYRADILHQIDFVEDIAIAYGYENFAAVLPKVATTAQEAPSEKIKRKIAYLLTGLGFMEVLTYHLIAKEDGERTQDAKKGIELENSISPEYNTLRPTMLPSLLGVLKTNKHNEYPQNIFDMGTVFTRDAETETGTNEEEHLAIMLANQKITITEAKQVLDYLMRMLNLTYKIEQHEDARYIPGRSGSILVHGKKIGSLGEIHPQVLENNTIEVPAAYIELNLSIGYEFLK